MRRRKFRPTYAGVMSTIAVFLALGGVSWAASSLARNSVGAKQIKKNAVRASEINKSAVSTSEVKNNSLGGDDINESKLGTVPSSATATDTLTPTLRRVGVSASNADPNAARTAATEVPLGSFGQVSIYGKCFLNSAGDDVYGEVFARTSANGSLLQSAQDDLTGNPYLNTGTLEVDRQLDASTASAANSTAASAGRGFQLVGADGNGIHGLANAFILNGPVAEGNGAYPAQESCIFSLTGTKIPAG